MSRSPGCKRRAAPRSSAACLTRRTCSQQGIGRSGRGGLRTMPIRTAMRRGVRSRARSESAPIDSCGCIRFTAPPSSWRVIRRRRRLMPTSWCRTTPSSRSPFRRQTAYRSLLPTGGPAPSPPRTLGGGDWPRAYRGRPSPRSCASVAAGRAISVAVAGPSIGACCYEVGGDVLQRFVRSGFSGDQLRQWFLERPAANARNPSMPAVSGTPLREEHWFFDGWAAVADQLTAVGLRSDQIFVAGSVHGEPSGRALLVSPRRPSGGTARRRDQTRPASSIAAFASRSACAFDSRRTCEKVTRSELVREETRLRVERLQPGMFHLVVAEHLLHEQQRVGSDVHDAVTRARAPIRARRAGRGTRRRCWSLYRWLPKTPQPVCRPAARPARHSPPGLGCLARRRRCTPRLQSRWSGPLHDSIGCGVTSADAGAAGTK